MIRRRSPCRPAVAVPLGRGACALALAALAASCGPGGRPIPVGEATLVVGVAQPAADDAADRSLSRVAALLSRASLLRLDRSCRARPGLATAATPSADGRTWHLTLGEGLRFHDGTPLDAAAVAAVLAPDSSDPLFQPPGLRDIAEVATPDARTVRLSLRAPSSLLPEALASLEIAGGPEGAAGAGPFVPAGGPSSNGLEMAAFDGYAGGRPAIGRLVLRSFPTARTAWAALMRREIDFLYEVAPEALGFVASSGDAQVRSFLRSYVYAVGFNVAHPALRSADVRRRLAASVDRAALIDNVFGGRAVAATDPVWPLHWAHDEPVGPARPSASAAGARVPPPPAMPSTAAAPRLVLRCLVPAGVPLFERLALHVQRDMLAAGVDLRLEPVPLAELSRRLARGDFDTYLLEMNGFGLSWTYWLWHSAASRPFVASGYRAADEALDALRRADTDDALRERLRLVRATFRDDPPAIFLCWPLTARAVTTRFALPTGEDHDVLTSVDRWVAVGEEP